MSSTLNILKPSVNNMTVRVFLRAAGGAAHPIDECTHAFVANVRGERIVLRGDSNSPYP